MNQKDDSRLYYRIPYVKEFDARVMRCERLENGHFRVILDKTAFYPEGGGQPSDKGTLGGVNVLHVEEKGGGQLQIKEGGRLEGKDHNMLHGTENDTFIVHETDGYLDEGTVVHGVLDWTWRFSLMQQHTGEHIFSGLVNKHFGYDNVGFHMNGSEMTVDWNGVMTWDDLMMIERETNEMIWRNLPVLSLWPSSDRLDQMDYRSKKALNGAVRIIEIPNCDTCACCGTHVNSTGEIGLVKVLDFIHYKGGVRVTLTAGRAAMEDYARKQHWMNQLGNIFSVPAEGIVEAARRVRQNESDQRYQIGQMKLHFLEDKAKMKPDSSEPLVEFGDGLSPDEARKYCTKLVELGKGSVVLVCSSKDEDSCIYAMGSSKYDVRALGKELNKEMDGRGGGSAMMVQGSFKTRSSRNTGGCCKAGDEPKADSESNVDSKTNADLESKADRGFKADSTREMNLHILNTFLSRHVHDYLV